MVLKLVERYPAIIQIGAAVLAFTAAKMVVSEPLLTNLFGDAKAPMEVSQSAARWVVYSVAIGGVLLGGKLAQSKSAITHG
jgi:predicted tellurium resistance membrane protein TerC